MLALLAQGINIGFAAGVTPGPLQAFLLLQTVQHGARHAMWIILSPLISDGPIVALILLVLGQASDGLLRAVGLIGGAFVLYIAWGLFRQVRAGDFAFDVEGENAPAAVVPPRRALRQAVTINALGPGPWLFWGTVMGPVTIAAWREAPPNAIAFVAGFYSTFLATMAVQVLFFHQARRLGPRAVNAVLWVGLVALVIFAASLWWNALT